MGERCEERGFTFRNVVEHNSISTVCILGVPGCLCSYDLHLLRLVQMCERRTPHPPACVAWLALCGELAAIIRQTVCHVFLTV